jgi:hypothetical protein
MIQALPHSHNTSTSSSLKEFSNEQTYSTLLQTSQNGTTQQQQQQQQQLQSQQQQQQQQQHQQQLSSWLPERNNTIQKELQVWSFLLLLILQDEEDSLKNSNCMSALSVDPYLPEAVVAFKKLCKNVLLHQRCWT